MARGLRRYNIEELRNLATECEYLSEWHEINKFLEWLEVREAAAKARNDAGDEGPGAPKAPRRVAKSR